MPLFRHLAGDEAGTYYGLMPDPFYPHRREFEQLSRESLCAYQLGRLNALLAELLANNPFYGAKLAGAKLPLTSLDELADLPLTTKDELVAAAESDSPNRSFHPEAFTRMHRTSGTRGKPLAIYDTADDWQQWIEIWQYVLDAADVTEHDRAVMAFSFGPFIGFWSANDALAWRGAMVIPAGGMSTAARLDLVADTNATVVCCTPTYALRMLEVAAELDRDLKANNVSKIIVAGEPGGSVPAIRDRIESAWGATVIDHSGATEIGPWGYADSERTGLHVAESHFIAEFLPTESKLQNSDAKELVLTTLARRGMPVVRYRTGDLVVPTYPGESDESNKRTNRFVKLAGGVLGRIDDMVVIRGVNIFPSSLEEILRTFPHVGEYRIVASRSSAMDELEIEVENQTNEQVSAIAERLQSQLSLRVPVTSVPADSLPRFEAKSRRFVDKR